MEEQNNFCSSNHNETQNNGRPLAHFHPDLWGDHFLNYTPPDEAIQTQREQEVRELKEEVRRKLLGIAKDYKERLILIDVVEQLGIAYHFEDEIEANLQHIYNYSKPNDQHEDDLHFVSLRFRLLRQHGFFASSDVFNKFKNEDGKFEESLTKDVLGILNLYEAANLRIHGEKILDEAVEFTTTRLKSLVGQLKNPLKAKVSRALKLPLQKGVIRLLSRYYISTYEDESAHDETILKFAKLDFNLLQTLHLKELRDLSRWWKDLDFGRKLPFARNRITEVYFWILGTFYEPKYTLGREIFTKLFKMTSIMDDTYDAYGLFPELVAYTEAVHRWDEKCTDQLPDYMKLTYEALLHTFADFERKLAKEGRSELVSYVRELIERKRDHVASVVECYKKQYGVNEEEAIKELQIIVEKAWMDLNEEMLRPTTFPMPLMTRILNLSRVIEVFYRLGEDDYSFVSKSMQDKIRLVLIDPIHV
ncbi:valencene synthase-like isoform X3 [Amaranthus tricolor]|uniref:valencene synthase-like isoform X3 n=1 Tax=Amaranthus tricolor TaxID=29722 RepID=UPI00258A56B6|nr:valencene synthase-like isoform X3 [Amaranthus tricolor]